MFEILTAIVVCAVTVVVSRRCGLWSLPSLATILFAVGYSVRLVVLRGTGQDLLFEAFYVQREQYRDMAGYGLMAFTAMCSGMFLGSTAWRKTPRRQAEAKNTVQYAPARLLLVALLALVLQAYLLSRSFGGIGTAIAALSRRTFVSESFAVAAAITPIAMPLLIAATVLAKRQGKRILWVTALLAFGLSLPWLMIVNGRATVIVAVWALALSSFLAFRNKPKAIALAGLGAIALATSVLGLAVRSSSQSGRSFAAEVEKYLGDSLAISSESIPIFDHTRVGMEYASVYGPSAESSIFNAFSVLIPRSIWPNKPEFLPQILGEKLKYTELSGLPAGLLGEGFINGGWFGAILLALAFGVFVGIAHRYTMRSAALTPVAAWAVFMGVNTVLVGLRTGAQGGLMTFQIALVALPVVAFLGWATKAKELRPIDLRANPHVTALTGATASDVNGEGRVDRRHL